MTDEVRRLFEAYRSRSPASVASRLDLLMDIERIRDPRVVPFLVGVMKDTREADDVRMHVLKQLRNGGGLVPTAERPAVAIAIGELLADHSSADLRLQAALALGEFIRIEGVLSVLNSVCIAQDESIDLRYAAFTSLERAGPVPECVALLRQMLEDDTLGRSARSVLSAWHLA